ncbi:MAG: DNA polymerase III subunit delta [Anaerolineales bacterium]|nr:DNA polymerase III subunit delta [Anaerolineales bacterium]
MPPRFHLLYGHDEFAMAEHVAALEAQLGDPSTASLNISRLDGRTVTLAEVQAACGAMPFLADFRLVVVEGWLTRLLGKTEDGETAEQEATASQRSGGSARDTMAALAAYLEEQPDTARLVLIEHRELPEKNIVLRAALGKPWAFVKRFDLPKGEQLVQWIQARAKAEGGTFTRDGALALAEAESDPRALGNEISKLLTYVNFARPVEAADVHTLTPAAATAHIFDFVDAIGQRRAKVAQAELHKLLEREEPLYVLGMIVRQFRLILLAKELLEARRPEAEVAATLGLHPFPAGKVCAQSRNFSLPALEGIYHRLLACDVEIKTGQADPATALAVLVVELTN